MDALNDSDRRCYTTVIEGDQFASVKKVAETDSVGLQLLDDKGRWGRTR